MERDLLIKIVEGQARQDERLKDIHEHTVTMKQDVDMLKAWKSRWGGASIALGGTGTVLGLLFGGAKVYAMVVGG